MNKNQNNIYQFVLRDMIGQGITGLSPTVRIRKDTGSFATTTNTPTEVGYGLYEVALTATECNCDIMAIEVSLPDGQFPAILTNEYLMTTGGATPAEIWSYTGDRTVTNTIPTASDNATAVWGATTRTLTNMADLETVLKQIDSGLFHWSVANNVLTIYDDTDDAIASYTLTKDSSGAIVAVTPIASND